MSVATTTAIAIGVGAASAASSVAAAKMQSNAAKKAAAIQGASQDKAQGFNQQVYTDQRAALNPYVQAGNDSLSRLMQQHWGTGGLAPGMSGTAMQPGQQVTPGSGYTPPAAGSRAPGMGTSPLLANAGGNPLAQAMPRAGAAPPQGPPGAPMPQGGAALIAVRAPTGEMAQFPEGSPGLQQALQKGAVRV